MSPLIISDKNHISLELKFSNKVTVGKSYILKKGSIGQSPVVTVRIQNVDIFVTKEVFFGIGTRNTDSGHSIGTCLL